MSFSVIPDRMVGYATYELAERLAALTTQQRAAIDRIVDHVYVRNLALAELLRGDNPICSERRYYDKGKMDEQTGHWLKRPGWHHDPEFQAALKEAVRLALMARTREELAAWQQAKRTARMATPIVVAGLTSIASATRLEEVDGQLVEVPRATEDKDRIAAAKILLDYAKPDETIMETETDAEQDWWEAAEGES